MTDSGRSTQPTGPTTLVLEARDLDTDERSREWRTVPSPAGPSEQRRQLTEAAAELHPNARLRSFANGAATFLDRQHLIVAFYADDAEPQERRADGSGAEQPALFA